MTTLMILQPILTGLSVGAFCLTYCFPFMGSFLIAEPRSTRTNLRLVLEFLLGRLAGYLCFGFLIGYFGERVTADWLRFATNLSFIFLSLLLTVFLAGLIKENRIFCVTTKTLQGKSPVLMGFLMGINLCPPFLLSITYVFSQHSMIYGVTYFVLFFLASSIYFLPLIFAGLLARSQEFRSAARISGYAVAGIFFIYGLYSLLHNS